MKTGTVKFFNVSKGFGFITVDGTNQELFVHVTGLVDQIRDGDKVTFEVPFRVRLSDKLFKIIS